MIHKTTRSILSVLLAALLLVTSVPLTPAFAGGGGVSLQSASAEGRVLKGDGTEEDPYQIATANDLREFAQRVNGGETTAYAVLTAGIVLNEKIEVDENGTVTNGDKLDQWTQIGNEDHRYTGTFDGANYTISGLYINDTTADYQGLFGYVSGSGKVQNLSVSGSVKGDDYVGGVVGYNDEGRVENCHNIGSVSGDRYVGGVVGDNRGRVINCTNTGSVKGSGDRVGGVVGWNDGGRVENCYNTGAVNSSGDRVGGVVGQNESGGTVKNSYNTGTVTGTDDYVSGVVGYNSGSVENCYNTGSVSGPASGPGNRVGGVVGYNSGTVKNCYNTGSVSGPDIGSGNSVGGVVGYNSSYNSSSVTNCYNTGSVTSSGSYVGGVVGRNDGSVKNCYNTGTVTGSSNYVGGVVGYNISSVTNCYFLQDTAGSGIGSGKPSEENVKSLTAEEFKKQDNFINWDFGIADTTTWSIHPVLGRPVLNENREGGDGSPDSPYEISTATQLENFRDLVNGPSGQVKDSDAHAKLMNNIDLNGNEKNQWTPIGNSSNSYEGTFDGNGKTIENLYINNTSSDYQGLFGRVNGGTVQDLTVSGSVSGHWYVGGVVGYNNGGNVTGCIFSGSGSVSVTGSEYVGGVVGYSSGGISASASVTNCYNTGTVTGTDDYVGGVVGYNSGSVENCYNIGNVSGNNYVGGVVGDNRGSVENCYNTGAVNSSGNYVGGVVGRNFGGVKNCYNTGTVTGTDDYVGGVVGYNVSGTVENCYNTGTVSDGTTSGGVVGQNSGSVTNCYFLSSTADVNENLSGIGEGSGTASNVEPRTADAFHSGEVAWLLENEQADGSSQVWGQNIGEDKSPVLTSDQEKTVYRVPVDLNYTGAQADQVIYTNSTLNAKEPTREGYTFDGWYDSNGNPVTAITATTAKLYAHWTAVEDPDPEPEEPPYTGKYSYEISTSVGDNGALSVDRYATEGDKVTIDVTPDQAYKLDDLTVTAHGKEVALTANSDGTYTFTMPSADVRITATFAEDPDWTPDEPEEPTTDVSEIFTDVAPNAWYKDAIQYAYDNGLMTGVSATEFDPEATTTRAMIVSILARLEGVESAEAAGFADVDDDWYATAVNWAANVGVVNGYEDNTFQPNTAITREQLAAILMNYAAYKGEDVSNRADLTSYTDQPSTWAEEAISWSVAEGLLTGVTADTLQPQGAATRAQVAAILQRFLSE